MSSLTRKLYRSQFRPIELSEEKIKQNQHILEYWAKRTPKKPVKDGSYYFCSTCYERVKEGDGECTSCGQKIEWSDKQ